MYKKTKTKPVENYLDYVHTVSFSLAFYIVLRPQGIRKQMKTLRKRHRVHIALVIPFKTTYCGSLKVLDTSEPRMRKKTSYTPRGLR